MSGSPTLERARQQAETLFQGASSEIEVLKRLNREPGTTPEQRVARAEAAAIVLSTPDLGRERARALMPFAPLLDPNPRAMKRLVNAYGISRSVEVLNFKNLSGSRTAQQRRALWTILNLRWPLLGAWFAAHPDDIRCAGSTSSSALGMGQRGTWRGRITHFGGWQSHAGGFILGRTGNAMGWAGADDTSKQGPARRPARLALGRWGAECGRPPWR
jgi:hypothetical protein